MIFVGASNESKTKYGGDGVNYKARVCNLPNFQLQPIHYGTIICLCVQFVGSEDVMDSTGSKIAQTAIGRIRVSTVSECTCMSVHYKSGLTGGMSCCRRWKAKSIDQFIL